MDNSRKIKKIILKAKILDLEEEEFNEKDTQFRKQFDVDFKHENDYCLLKEEQSEEKVPLPEPIEEQIIIDNKHLKEIHRELAKLTHPDLNPHLGDDTEFKRMQKAYETADGATLVVLAIEKGIDVVLAEEEFEKINEQIEKREQAIKQKKQTIRWAWCMSKKDEDLRKKIRQMYGIDEEKYQEWLTGKSS